MPLLPSLLGLFRRKAYPVPTVPGSGSGGWYPIVREPFAGAWQRNIFLDRSLASTFHADFACKTLIARDIGKLPVRLMESDKDGIWAETVNTAFSPVLRKPNHYQTRNQFWESWILSKLSRGNTYVLKEYDNRRVVRKLYVLDPSRIRPMVADDGSVFYEAAADELAGVADQVRIPATEIIHDRFNCLFHPLVGLPPIFASGLAAMQGLNIQNQSVRLFANNSQPGGILTAPGEIRDATAERLKTHWEANFSGQNVGRVAVLGDGLKYEKMSFTAEESQLVEQLKWTAEVVCSTYHVPPYKIGVGALPSYNNVQALNVEYYSQCLQSLIEDAESCLDEGLGLGEQYQLGVEFDVENLLRMDGVTQADFATKLVKGGVYTPNEGRKRFNLKKLAGGDTVYMQQQDIPMAIAASVEEHPLNKVAAPAPAPASSEMPPEEDMEDDMGEEEMALTLAVEMRKALGLPLAA